MNIFRGFMGFMFFGPFHENREAGRYIDLLFLENPPKKDAKTLSLTGNERLIVVCQH